MSIKLNVSELYESVKQNAKLCTKFLSTSSYSMEKIQSLNKSYDKMLQTLQNGESSKPTVNTLLTILIMNTV